MIVSDLDRDYRKKLILGRHLLTGGIGLTHFCNLDCIHCYIKDDNPDNRHEELNTKEVLHMLKQMKDAGVVYLHFSGGEPLFRPDFQDIYLFAKKKNFAINVTTNATLITKDLIELFKKYPPLMLVISCYGVTKDTYESVTRTPGSFAKFKKAIKLLKNSGINVNLRFTAMRNNYKEAAMAEIFAQKMGMRYKCTSDIYLRLDGDKTKNAVIKNQRLNAEETVDLFNIMREDLGKFYSSSDGGYTAGCGAASIGGFVDSKGMLMPCYYMGKPSVSLKETDFKKAWESIALVKNPVIKKREVCKNCRHMAYCHWCPGVSYLETGNSEKKVRYFCRLMDDLTKMKLIGSQ